MSDGFAGCHDAGMEKPVLTAREPIRFSGSLRLHAWLLSAWFAASFGVVFFAHDLQFVVNGWPVGYWLASQGSVFIFIAIVAAFAWFANKASMEVNGSDVAHLKYTRRLHVRFAIYVSGLLLFLIALAIAERWGLKKLWVGAIFLFSTVAL